MGTRYAGAFRAVWWAAGAAAAVAYGIFLTLTALRLHNGAGLNGAGLNGAGLNGAALNGQFWAQPVAKASMAILLAVAASLHPIVRERHWLVPALLLSALGDFFLAIPWWKSAFVCGLGAFLVAHLCYLGALLPLRGNFGRTRVVTAGAVVIACGAMLARFWPRLSADGMTLPVTVYISVLGAMVCSALVARLPTPWTALGAVLFAVSDGMIGIGQFVLGSKALELPIWWVYAASQVLITAGFFFGRSRD